METEFGCHSFQGFKGHGARDDIVAHLQERLVSLPFCPRNAQKENRSDIYTPQEVARDDTHPHARMHHPFFCIIPPSKLSPLAVNELEENTHGGGWHYICRHRRWLAGWLTHSRNLNFRLVVMGGNRAGRSWKDE